eukprot:m51a1_g2262 hypothetical protein (135) ;mRNA; f:334598-335125
MAYQNHAETLRGPNAAVVSCLFMKWSKGIGKYSNKVRCYTSRALGMEPQISLRDPKEFGVRQTDRPEEAVKQMLEIERRGLECVQNVYKTITESREDQAVGQSFHLAEHLFRHILIYKEKRIAWLYSLTPSSSR